MNDFVTIDNEIKRHSILQHVKNNLFDEFDDEIHEALLRKHSTKGYVEEFDQFESLPMLDAKFKGYRGKLQNSIDLVKCLFAKHNILFRLYDLDIVVHNSHRICLAWIIQNKEYAIELVFGMKVEYTELPLLFRVVEIDEMGEVSRGDMSPQDANELTKDCSLPEWLVKILKDIN